MNENPPVGGPAAWAYPGYPPQPPAWPHEEPFFPLTTTDRASGSLARLFRPWRVPERAPAGVLGGAVASVLIAAILLQGGRGVNIPLTALAVTTVAGHASWSAGRMATRRGSGLSVNRTGLAFALAALALACTPAFRDAPWVVWLCLTLSLPLTSYALCGGRTWTELIGGGLMLPVAAARMLPWSGRGAARLGGERSRALLLTMLIVAGLLTVFGALFAMADAAFRAVILSLLPGSSIVPAVIWATLTALLALSMAFLALAPPPFHALVPRSGRPVEHRWMLTAPLVALNALFALFCAVQATVLFAADKDKLLAGAGLSYAEYAREGFAQLVIVTVLVLAVIAVAVRYAPRATRRDRVLTRTLLGTLCALTLVVVVVALRRMVLYEEEFGWTRLRLWVLAFELWLGLVIVLIAAAGARLRSSWLPRAVAASGAAGLLALALVNPDSFIAERNITRANEPAKIDLGYLRGLSADAVPALDRLPEPYRSCALRDIDRRLGDGEPWTSANSSRARARSILARRPVNRSADCG